MLLLYKQYLEINDEPLVSLYKAVSYKLNQQPIICLDNTLVYFDTLSDVAIFHTLYLTRIQKSKLLCIVISEHDKNILNTISIPNHNIIMIDQTKSIDSIISYIKESYNDKL